MKLGEKLRQARLEKGLSQRQLCGEELTRNMLSQIENGSARPSMDTLQLFARRLGKPVSWFLEEAAAELPNRQVMEQLRQAFVSREYDRIGAILESYKEPDEIFDGERYLLEALSLTEQAKEIGAEKPIYGRKLLDRAWEAGEKTPYFTEPYRREWLLTAALVREDAQALAAQLPVDDRELILRAKAAMAEKDWNRCGRLLEAAENRNAAWQLLRGEAALAQGNYALAAEHYRQAETAFPGECAKALEICYRELEDYKLAYYYACKQR